MAPSPASGPDDRAALSIWERRVLAQIENDLAASDPGLARVFGGHGSVPTRRWWWPLSVHCTMLLLVNLLVLIAASAVARAWWPVLGLITTVVVVPWIVLCAYEQRGSE